jgi:CheY-like chemotaxis protein
MMPTEPHRRKDRRVALAEPIVAHLAAGHEAQVRDLSAGGVRLEHEGVLRPGESCLFRFVLSDEVFAFSGRVVWSRAIGRAPSGRPRCQSGVVFEGIPSAAKPLLAQLLGGTRSRVLIVEDDQPVREILSSALATAGYEVHEVADGPEALEKAEEVVPDVVLLDVRMPGIDGFEVCRELKERPATRRVPVILVTGVDDQALYAQATAAGATACLTKPFRLESLLALTRTVIENAWR